MFTRPSARRLIPVGVVSAVLALAILIPATPLAALGAGYSNRYGGVLRGGPDATTANGTKIDAYVRGTDDALYQADVNNGSFTGWTSLGGGIADDPAGEAVSPTSIYVFAEGRDDHALWTRSWNGTTWGPWSSLGGVILFGPDAAVQGVSGLRIDVFGTGVDHQLYTRTFNGTTWGAWSSLGGYVTQKPGVVSWGSGNMAVFVRGIDNALYTRTFSGGVWGAWSSLGGGLMFGAEPMSCSAGHLDVYVVGAGGQLYHRGYNGAWTGWDQTNLGGTWTSNLGAVCNPGTTQGVVFGRGTDNALYSWIVTGT
jgi:hypothetical protein